MTNSSSNDLDQILADLEAKFGAPPQEKVVQASDRQSSTPRRSSFSLKSVFGALVFALLVTASAAGIYLTSESQDLRQQAQVATSCVIQYSGTDSFTTTNCQGNITVYNGPSCPTTDSLVRTEQVENGKNYAPGPPSGQCQQIDHTFGGVDEQGNTINPGGVCSCSSEPPKKAICGESCQVDSDCAPSTGGAPVVCHNNKCANANCPGDTANGTICFCKTANRKCGDPCGKNQLPLCDRIGDENNPPSECGYIGNVNQCSESIANNQYCLPREPQNGYTRRTCTNGVQASNLRRPDGGNVTTRAQVYESCFPAPTATPTLTPEPTATFTPEPTATPEPTSTPIATNTLTPTVTPAPICVSISATNITAPFPDSAPRKNDQLTFTCGEVTGATRYEFRVRLPDYTYTSVQPVAENARTSQPFTFSESGNHLAQCRICTGLEANSCSEWE